MKEKKLRNIRFEVIIAMLKDDSQLYDRVKLYLT